MLHYSLSWTFGKGLKCSGGSRENPKWAEVVSSLEQARVLSGSVTLSATASLEKTERSLQVFTECDVCLLMLEEDNGEEHIVRASTDSAAIPGKVEILGDLWDTKMVFSDFNIVRAVFQEFFDTGDVSPNLLRE